MQKMNLLFLLLLNCSLLFSQSSDNQLLSTIRNDLPSAFESDSVCSALLNKYKSVSTSDPLLSGYIGGLYFARSKHAPLTSKISALKTGTEKLETAIEKKPNNVELLFLRLTIQLNLPRFLGYNDDIESDKLFVLDNYKSAPPILKSRIINFIKTSGHFNESEISKVEE